MPPTRPAIGIRDLARELGVSIGTVSRALNGRPDVNPETRARVMAAAEALGYVANQSGRSLRRGTTNTVGMMVESGSETASRGDNFFVGITDGLQRRLWQHRLDLVLLPCATDEDPEAFLRRIVARQMVDGMILTATQRVDPRISLLDAARIPFVTLGRSTTDAGHPWIDLDFEDVVYRSVDRLVARGHRRIAIGLPASDVNLGAVAHGAYREALARHGLPDTLVIRRPVSEAGGYAIADALLHLPQRPTAVMLIHDLMALGLYRRLLEDGIVPGRDIAVIGFREAPQTRFLSPRLTSFRLDLRELGSALADSLLAAMPDHGEPDLQRPPGRLWPMVLTEGESDARGTE